MKIHQENKIKCEKKNRHENKTKKKGFNWNQELNITIIPTWDEIKGKKQKIIRKKINK